MDSQQRERLRDQKDDLDQFLDSRSWSYFEGFMKRRRTYFVGQLMGAIKSHDWEKTKIYHALMEETDSVVAEFRKEPKRLEGIIDEGIRS